ncbi:hypothetical protein LCGC14_2997850 [marine sediment metagenome]|uniref:Terminase small subunit n=1 Tax=marine sediment metagenome TaxID=412755 RepID=A0A0F8ZT23_9ZZZZ
MAKKKTTKKVTPKASKKKTSKKRMPRKDKDELTLQQTMFCQLFATHKEFFGNGVQSYIEAYNIPPSRYRSAKTLAGRLLTKVAILAYINEILVKTGFSDEFADKQLSMLMTQNADFKSKLGAIKEYNALKSRITKLIDHTTDGEKITPQVVMYGKPDDTKPPV